MSGVSTEKRRSCTTARPRFLVESDHSNRSELQSRSELQLRPELQLRSEGDQKKSAHLPGLNSHIHCLKKDRTNLDWLKMG